MKIFLAFLVIGCCCHVVVARVGKNCHKQNECQKDECCSAETTPATCIKLGQEGDDCFPDVHMNFHEGKYLWMCPCARGLHCGVQSIETRSRVTIYSGARCRAK